MASAVTESGAAITIGNRLRRAPALAAKVRALDEALIEVFGKDTPIEWELEQPESGNQFVLHVGEPGKGECTRWILEANVDETSWLKNELFEDMKVCLDTVQRYLREVEQLFQQMRTWLSNSLPSYRIKELITTVEEVNSGKYAAKKLLITHKKQEMEILPRGVWWVTTEGLVELVSENAEHQLILSWKEGGWLWTQERPTVTLRPLTEQLFVQLVKDCLE